MKALNRCWILFACVALTACASARRKIDGDLVAGISFDGRDGGIQGVQLRGVMAQKSSPLGVRTPVLRRLVKPVAFDERLLADDVLRIETWLAHQGWFDAEMRGFSVHRLRERRLRRDGTVRKAGVVKIVGQIEQGSVSRLRELRVEWEDDVADRFWRSAQVGTVQREGMLAAGSPFVLANVDYTRDMLARNIRNLGYAYATVDTDIEAWPDQHEVQVTFRVRTGPTSVRARPRLHYDGRVWDRDIRQILNLEEPANYRFTDLTRARDRLTSLGTFSVVRVEPDLSDPTRDEVPIDVTLSDARFGAARTGVGLVYNGVTVTPRVSATVKHANIDGRLARFEGGASIGAGIPVVGTWVTTRMLGGANAGIVRPRTFHPKLDSRADLSFRRELLAGQLLFARSRFSSGFSWRFDDHIVFDIGPGFEFNRLGGGNPFGGRASLNEEDKLLATATFGDARRNPFFLALAEAKVSIDWRKGAAGQEAAIDPRGGYYYLAGVRQAVPLSDEGPASYRFTDIFAEARFYRSILSADKSRVPVTFALRLRGKWLPSLAGASLLDAVPYAERGFLGGSLDMRGFRINQVGAYDCVCLAREEQVTRGLIWPFVSNTGVYRLRPNPTYLPRGGRFSGLVSGEVRWRTTASWGLAAFADAGVLTARIEDLVRLDKTLRWDVGVGFRQSTPVGPIRIDLAVRPAFPEDLGPFRSPTPGGQLTPSDPEYFRGQTFGCDPFPDGALSRRVPGLAVSPRFGKNLPPVIFNLAIAIGEAI